MQSLCGRFTIKLGVVSFLNSKPLIAGLESRAEFKLRFAVPAELTGLLERGEVDVALVPVVDVLRSGGALQPISDACIACDGETMTVRVFAQVPPHQVETLHVDGDSHTSVVLARVLWRALFGVDVVLEPLTRGSAPADYPAVLLIGDKVVDPARGSFAYEVDLGGAWRQLTGLPFVFAVWAVRRGALAGDEIERVASVLALARDAGVGRVREIVAREAAAHGWSAASAERYLGRCLRYRLDARMRSGAERFAGLAAECGAVPAGSALDWSRVSAVSTQERPATVNTI